MSDISKLKVAELRTMLAARGLPVSGRKAEIIERLNAAIINDDSSSDDEDEVCILNHCEVLEVTVLSRHAVLTAMM